MLLGGFSGVIVLGFPFVYGISMTDGLGWKASLNGGMLGAGAMILDCE